MPENNNNLPPEFDISHCFIPDDEDIENYVYLKTKEIDNTIKVYPEQDLLFFSLFKEAKYKLFKQHGLGSYQSEVMMVVEGNKILFEILKKYNIIPILNIYRILPRYFNISAIRRIPQLNLSTVFKNKNDEGEKLIIHVPGTIYTIISDWATLLSISRGYVVYSDIMLYFGQLWKEIPPYDNDVKEYLYISDRLERAIKAFYSLAIEHLVSIKSSIEDDVENYEYMVEKGKGDAKTLYYKQKQMYSLKKLIEG